MPDETDAKEILTASPRRTGGDHQDVLILHGWIQQSNNLSVNEATDMAENRPLWKLVSTFGATHSQWCNDACQKRRRNV